MHKITAGRRSFSVQRPVMYVQNIVRAAELAAQLSAHFSVHAHTYLHMPSFMTQQFRVQRLCVSVGHEEACCWGEQ